ncbi:hypothetical protein YC2023_037212 [Brassica napus]
MTHLCNSAPQKIPKSPYFSRTYLNIEKKGDISTQGFTFHICLKNPIQCIPSPKTSSCVSKPVNKLKKTIVQLGKDLFDGRMVARSMVSIQEDSEGVPYFSLN